MPKKSAGLLLFRKNSDVLEVLLVHPGGPFWKNKDEGAWTIPKGETEADEDLFARARTEFEEEIGINPTGKFAPLGSIKQKLSTPGLSKAICLNRSTALKHFSNRMAAALRHIQGVPGDRPRGVFP